MKQSWPHEGAAWQTRSRQTIIRENKFGEFSGIQQTLLFLDNVRVEVFQGIKSGILKSCLAHDDAMVRAEREELLGRIHTRDLNHVQRFGFQRTENVDGIGALSVSPDGTILEFRFVEA